MPARAGLGAWSFSVLRFDLLQIIESHAEGRFRLRKNALQQLLELFPVLGGFH